MTQSTGDKAAPGDTSTSGAVLAGILGLHGAGVPGLQVDIG